MDLSLLKERVKQLAREKQDEAIRIRRHLHQHPELSYQEAKTSAFVAQQLKGKGISVQEGVAGFGLVAMIEGQASNEKVVALRADMDALPILEKNDVPYRSVNEGVMHACGHDVHTTSLLVAADILHELRHELSGTLKLLFQPAEEKIPGGASLMIKEGVLESPTVHSIVGQHVHPPLDVGKVGFKQGQYMASADEIIITVKGRGGHGALPQDCIDPVLIASHLITSIQQIVSRRSNPGHPSVLTFGRINSVGGAYNVIPNAVELQGTFRTMNEDWRKNAHGIIREMAISLCRSMGGDCDVKIKTGYPSLFNDPALTARAKQFAVDYLGEDQVVDLPIRLTAEDFAYYSHQIPGCFYRLGTGNADKNITSPVHTDTFDVDEDCLEIGSGLMAWIGICELDQA